MIPKMALLQEVEAAHRIEMIVGKTFFLLVLHFLVAFEGAGVVEALFCSLETTVSEFGRSVDPFEGDLFLCNGVRWRMKRSSERDWSRHKAGARSF